MAIWLVADVVGTVSIREAGGADHIITSAAAVVEALDLPILLVTAWRDIGPLGTNGCDPSLRPLAMNSAWLLWGM